MTRQPRALRDMADALVDVFDLPNEGIAGNSHMRMMENKWGYRPADPSMASTPGAAPA